MKNWKRQKLIHGAELNPAGNILLQLFWFEVITIMSTDNYLKYVSRMKRQYFNRQFFKFF